ncbi:hypothetical protein OH76DRAFT_1366168 [Lentinus brumalis]|uniref:Uncharacterized protein n=1 Tax=Lentinus brumalis TaxID=2498619 RepID=A0A371CJM6_9APHY|nr:hypothetical protein OH76DRAFT_1366168 [Polyporus brumalis]
MCQSLSNAELGELLRGIKNRHECLDIPMPEMFIADNCCYVRGTIQSVFPGVHVALDVFHLLGRYLAVVHNGTKNPLRGAVAKDVVDAIVKNRAGEDGHKYARYRNRAEQEKRLNDVFDKWARKGSVWSVAAAKVHADQLNHVKKGCLERTREDLTCNGSRIEGSHKGWNSIMRSFPSGIVMFTSLGHDLVLRRNLRRAMGLHLDPLPPEHLVHTAAFATSISGSHHVRLANNVHKLWNSLAAVAKRPSRPILRSVAVNETFGLVPSEYNATFGGLLQMPKEESDDEDTLEKASRGELSCLDPSTSTISYLNIDPRLLDAPLPRPSTTLPLQPTSPDPSAMSLANPVAPAPGLSLTPAMLSSLAQTQRATMVRPASTVSIALSISQAQRSCHHEARPEHRLESSSLVILQMSSSRATGTLDSFLKISASLSAGGTTNICSDGTTNADGVEKSHPTRSDTASTVAALTAPLSLPFTPSPSKLTPSERLFHVTTHINPLSLKIGESDEFFTFMDLRASEKWTSFGMTSHMWVKATVQYNKTLADRCRKQGIAVPLPKLPRALVDKLHEVEAMIVKRVSLNDYTCIGGSEEFWRRHCHVVSLVKADSGKSAAAMQRAQQTCARCKQIKYPGGLGSAANHKKKHCSDGVRCGGSIGSDVLPDWPQPPGLFSKGTHFNAIEFLKALRDLHEKAIVNEGRDLVADLECLAFAKMFHARTTQAEPNGPFLFRLFEYLTLAPALPELVVEHNGLKHLRLDCLGGGAPAVASTSSS